MSIPAGESRAKVSPLNWDGVHEEIQSALQSLADQVSRRCPGTLSRGHRTEGRLWFLYSYRDFQDPQDAEAEGVVAGVMFSPSGEENGIQVQGELVGEESGHTYFETEKMQVPALQSAVLTVARDIADHLSHQVELCVKALEARRRPPVYRDLAK